jgi:hypothetical protein
MEHILINIAQAIGIVICVYGGIAFCIYIASLATDGHGWLAFTIFTVILIIFVTIAINFR